MKNLQAVIGTMKSAKTLALIEYTRLIEQENKTYVVFHPACCAKDDEYVVTRHKSQKTKAIKVFEIQDMYAYVKSVDICLIDEFQFICDNSHIDDFMEFLEYCDTHNIEVVLFGLSLDYMSSSFEVTQRVLPYCDNIIVQQAKCEICGEPASRCIRYIDDVLDNDPNSSLLLMEKQNVVYKSVCRKCYREITGSQAIK